MKLENRVCKGCGGTGTFSYRFVEEAYLLDICGDCGGSGCIPTFVCGKSAEIARPCGFDVEGQGILAL